MKPLTLTTPEVRELLDKGSVVVRRAIKLREFQPSCTPGYDWTLRDRRALWNDYRASDIHKVCPIGSPGEKRWVREGWQVATGRISGDLGACVRYRDTELNACWMPPEKVLPFGLTWDHWRSPVTMPRWASRLDATIASVEVEKTDRWEWVVGVKR